MEYKPEDIAEYLVMLITEFAQKFSLSMQQAYRYLHLHGGIAMAIDQYGIIHTLSFEDAVDGLANFCHRKGGALI